MVIARPTLAIIILFAIGISPAEGQSKVYGVDLPGVTVTKIDSSLAKVSDGREEKIIPAREAPSWILSRALGKDGNLIPASDLKDICLRASEAKDSLSSTLAFYYLAKKSDNFDWENLVPSLVVDNSLLLSLMRRNKAVYIEGLFIYAILNKYEELYRAIPYSERMYDAVAKLSSDKALLAFDWISGIEPVPLPLVEAKKCQERWEKVIRQQASGIIPGCERNGYFSRFLIPTLMREINAFCSDSTKPMEARLTLALSVPDSAISPDLLTSVRSIINDPAALPFLSNQQLFQPLKRLSLRDDGLKQSIGLKLSSAYKTLLERKEYGAAERVFERILEFRKDPNQDNDDLRFFAALKYRESDLPIVSHEKILEMSKDLTFLQRLRWFFWTLFLSALAFCIIGSLLIIRLTSRIKPGRDGASKFGAAKSGAEEEKVDLPPQFDKIRASQQTEQNVFTENRPKEEGNNDKNRSSFVQLEPDRHLSHLKAEYEEVLSVLGIAPGASVKEIKTAFRDKVKQVHPDMGGEGGKAGSSFMDVNGAYEKALELRKKLGIPDR